MQGAGKTHISRISNAYLHVQISTPAGPAREARASSGLRWPPGGLRRLSGGVPAGVRTSPPTLGAGGASRTPARGALRAQRSGRPNIALVHPTLASV